MFFRALEIIKKSFKFINACFLHTKICIAMQKLHLYWKIMHTLSLQILQCQKCIFIKKPYFCIENILFVAIILIQMERPNGRSNGSTNSQTINQSIGRTVRRSDGRTVERSDGRTVRRLDGRTVGRSDGRTVRRSPTAHLPRHVSPPIEFWSLPPCDYNFLMKRFLRSITFEILAAFKFSKFE